MTKRYAYAHDLNQLEKKFSSYPILISIKENEIIPVVMDPINNAKMIFFLI
ncbi:hypothetical protein TPENAI_70502 [Tenacibaculum litopenaei]